MEEKNNTSNTLKNKKEKVSLAIANPELAKEWHPTRNGDLTPSDFLSQSNKKVWWLGKCGHEWEASISSRNNKKLGCPYCSNHRLLPGYNDLATVNPELAKQWHPTKNGDLKQHQVTAGSNKKVWWICEHGHEWEASVCSRNKGIGCPYCSGYRILPGFNDLATKNPELAKEWHPTKNGDLTPSQVFPSGKIKVWWLCSKCGHEWKTTINHRSSRGTGCPNCMKDKLAQNNVLNAIKRNGTLVKSCPKIAAEWHPTKNDELTPEMVSPNSNKKVWWLCPTCGHEWEASIVNRSKGRSCPVCTRRKALPGFNDLATVEPELAAQWHPTKNGDLLPIHVTAGTHRRIWWICEHGHEWQATVANRVTDKSGCPVCKNRKVLKGYNDLESVYPNIAAQWHPTKNGDLKPSEVVFGSHKKVWWLCSKCGHEWQAQIDSRKVSGCPSCSKERHTSFPEKALFFYIFSVFPDTIASQHFDWLGSRELDIYIPSIHTAVEYDGEKWHQDTQRDIVKNHLCEQNGIRLIRIREPECPVISGECIVLESLQNKDFNKAINMLFSEYIETNIVMDVDVDRDRFKIFELLEYAIKEMSLAALYPEIAKEWHPTKNGELTPDKVMAGTPKKVWWMCEHGHEWEMKISNRTTSMLKQNCPICANQKVLSGYNDLLTLYPEIAKEWHPTRNGKTLPSQVLSGSGKKAWWICEHGHEWEMAISKRTSGKQGCPYCSNHRLLPGYNDLATTHPDIAAEWHPTKNGDLKPSDVSFGSEKKVWWRCEKGHEWQADVMKRTSGRGCPYCGNKKILLGYNDLATTHPDIAAQWHPTKNGDLKPTDVVAGSNKKVWWQCSKGHEWQATIVSRSSGIGCPVCSGKQVLAGYNDLLTLCPEIANQWHPTKNGDLLPSDVTPGSGKKVWWMCEHGHEWEDTINHRFAGRGCPYCSNHRVLSGFNDLATIRPDLVPYWHPTKNGDLLPSDVTPNSNKKIWWMCPKCGYEWVTSPNNIKKRRDGCKKCKKI